MKPLKPGEIHLLAQTLHHLEGARLQGVFTSKKDVILEFWLKGNLYFIWYEDSTLRPFLSFWPDQLPLKIKKSQVPLGLFLKAHFVGKHLKAVSFQVEYGRVLKLYFEEEFFIEFRLFPHGQNVIAATGEKTVSLHKPKVLHAVSSPAQDTSENEALRSVEEFSLEWLQFHRRSSGPTKSSPEVKAEDPDKKNLEKKKKKLKKAIDQVAAELERKASSLWREVGEWLQTHNGFEGLPEDYVPFVDKRRSVHWNVDHVFQKAKDSKKKMAGTEERLRLLKEELRNLEKEGVKALKSSSPSKAVERASPQSPVKARTFQMAPDLRAMAGKSAQDNMNLLRQAKPWDLWFHLKDWPSSHMIVFRPKKRELTPKEEHQVIQWFFRQNFGQKWEQEKGNKHEVIIAECRFVKPIKGDRSGRVHYHNERSLRVKVLDS